MPQNPEDNVDEILRILNNAESMAGKGVDYRDLKVQYPSFNMSNSATNSMVGDGGTITIPYSSQTITVSGNNYLSWVNGSFGSPYILDALPVNAKNLYIEIENGYFVMKYTILEQLKAEAKVWLKIPIEKILNIKENFESIDIDIEKLKFENARLKFALDQQEENHKRVNKETTTSLSAINTTFTDQLKVLTQQIKDVNLIVQIMADDKNYWMKRATAAEKELEDRKKIVEDHLMLDL